ncbi:type II toxin-antitoxin system HipA family toxin [Variovorax sp. J22P240]|uniref:type II toxin-antitoxin system HipA family toxin n=1 Tax=Variovorax sp. J22P240 TaxID=3053514 RepID=UPI00257604FD|nr:type II toxin-antitoxin system HipA family toxin [Variovorax sp. J22P240]MDL9997623.1 type II toxin-antitoxin system HipA family toxin [Variovorax sp. J22P240]
MSVVRSLRIRRGRTDVGSLFGLDDGRVYFRFDDEYAKNPKRPVLSQLYVVAPAIAGSSERMAQAIAEAEAATVAQLLDPALDVNRGDGKFGLPPFFQNLLPEGPLRKQLVGDIGLEPNDELGLLAACGGDLPGDVWADAETLEESALGRLIGQSRDSYEMSSGQVPTPQQTSISGVQPKMALVHGGPGRYVMRSRQSDEKHFIGKLPTAEYDRLPEVEYSSLKLAAAAGVNTCEASLQPLSAIADQLPYALQKDERNFLLVSRFDRDVDTETRRLHMEDFAQVTGTPSEYKYSGTYAAIGLLLKRRSAKGEADVAELLRRIKVSELLGNYDAHLKNFSLIYPPGQIWPELSKAYDIVAYGVYFKGSGHGLQFFPGQKDRTLLTPATLRQLANAWDIPEKRLSEVVANCVDQAMRTWPVLSKELPLTPAHRARLAEHIESNASVVSWRRRHPDAVWF